MGVGWRGSGRWPSAGAHPCSHALLGPYLLPFRHRSLLTILEMQSNLKRADPGKGSLALEVALAVWAGNSEPWRWYRGKGV